MRIMILALAGLGIAQTAVAADLRETRGERQEAEYGPNGLVVEVDDLYVRYRRCARDPDCISPRVLPILSDGRRGTYTTVTIPIDPKFADRYPAR